VSSTRVTSGRKNCFKFILLTKEAVELDLFLALLAVVLGCGRTTREGEED
jgi:hypothetical protein